MDEFALIAGPLQRLTAWPLTDDAALLSPPPGTQLVITKDAMVQGVHFVGNETPGRIAQKLLRANLSDLAAMGAEPFIYFLALMLPRATDEEWVSNFCAGLNEDQRAFGIALAGGDTTATPGPLCLSITALGTVPAGKALTRAGAQPGEDIYVSGTIGDAALGLASAQPFLKERYLLPQPRVSLGVALRGLASACLDISDGLVQDAAHLARASRVKLCIEARNIPLSPAPRAMLEADNSVIETILAGGDDYELLFTAPPSKAERIMALGNVTRIGVVEPGEGVEVRGWHGEEIKLARTGYRHFRE